MNHELKTTDICMIKGIKGWCFHVNDKHYLLIVEPPTIIFPRPPIFKLNIEFCLWLFMHYLYKNCFLELQGRFFWDIFGKYPVGFLKKFCSMLITNFLCSVLMTSIGENISPHILLSRAKILLEKLWNEPEPVANLAGVNASFN